MIRLWQVIKHGWRHSAQMIPSTSNILTHCMIFLDMLYCFFIYKMWSNQYLKEKFYYLSNEERQKIGGQYKIIGEKRDAWQKDFRKNRNFWVRYSAIKYEKASLRSKRCRSCYN